MGLRYKGIQFQTDILIVQVSLSCTFPTFLGSSGCQAWGCQPHLPHCPASPQTPAGIPRLGSSPKSSDLPLPLPQTLQPTPTFLRTNMIYLSSPGKLMLVRNCEQSMDGEQPMDRMLCLGLLASLFSYNYCQMVKAERI